MTEIVFCRKYITVSMCVNNHDVVLLFDQLFGLEHCCKGWCEYERRETLVGCMLLLMCMSI